MIQTQNMITNKGLYSITCLLFETFMYVNRIFTFSHSSYSMNVCICWHTNTYSTSDWDVGCVQLSVCVYKC